MGKKEQFKEGVRRMCSVHRNQEHKANGEHKDSTVHIFLFLWFVTLCRISYMCNGGYMYETVATKP